LIIIFLLPALSTAYCQSPVMIWMYCRTWNRKSITLSVRQSTLWTP